MTIELSEELYLALSRERRRQWKRTGKLPSEAAVILRIVAQGLMAIDQLEVIRADWTEG